LLIDDPMSEEARFRRLEKEGARTSGTPREREIVHGRKSEMV
jgi:hypothetical protein